MSDDWSMVEVPSAQPPYRAMERVDLDADARELDAVAALGRWRMGVRSRALTIACIAGAIAGVAGFFVAEQVQLAAIQRAWISINVVGFVTPFALSVVAGLVIARLRIRAGTDQMVRELSDRFQLEPDRLAVVAELVGRL